jgi:hypothetical protein
MVILLVSNQVIRSMATDEPCETLVSLWAKGEATHAGGGSQPDKRHGMAAEIQRSSAVGKTPHGGFSNKYFRTQHLLRGGDLIRVFDTSSSMFPVIEMLP